MLALLKLIPWKDVAYVAVILGLVGWIFHKGEAHVEAADTKVAIAAQNDVKRIDIAAQTTESQNAIIFEKAVAIPAVGDIGDECVRVAPSGGVVSAANTGKGAAASDSTVNTGGGSAFDPSGAVLTRAAQADAQITYLQGRIRELESQMNGAP
jgi:hypothetical protein